ncbi:alpha/beta hydrolase [Dietzia sp. NPDC055877]
MVMADRPEVQTASPAVAAITMVGLGQNLLTGLARVPFVRPWQGPGNIVDNLGQSVTRQTIRSFMGYSLGLPIEEFRSMEQVIDGICSVVLPPYVRGIDGVTITREVIGGVPGLWCRRSDGKNAQEQVDGTILYLHGGGYIGTSPMMYAAFASATAKRTGCDIFIADYRMAPEFPFPAGVLDAASVYAALLEQGIRPENLIIAGDSGGGGLAASLISHLNVSGMPVPAALALFSPETDLELDQPSVSDNARYDILPWNVPTAPYLQGIAPGDPLVSTVNAALSPDWFPPTFVTSGGNEMFRDGIRELVAHLRDADIEVHAIEAEGMFHVFPILMPWLEVSRRVFEELDEFVDSHVRSRRYIDIGSDED